MQVSAYTAEDFVAIEPIARECFLDFKYPGRFDREEFFAQYQPLVEAGIMTVLRVDDDGVLGIAFGKNAFNGWREALINFWFVKPGKRHLGIGRDLLLAAEAIAADRGCWRVLMGHPVGHIKFFLSMGYQPVEVGFQKIL